MYKCENCKKKLYRKTKTGLCKECFEKQRCIDNNIPSKQQLLQDREQLHFLKSISEKYNKSQNTIWRWFKKYNIKVEKKENFEWKWYCQTCNQYFRTQPEFYKHKSIHPHICKYCGQEFETGVKLGGHQRLCKLNPDYVNRLQAIKQRISKEEYRHSEQTKQKIRQIRKQYFLDHPQNIFWKKGEKFLTPPCQQLKQFLKQNNIIFEAEYINPDIFNDRLYALDIAILDKKIDIQINGKQHYKYNKNLTDYFQQRHNIIEQAGWKVLQIPNRLSYSINFRLKLIDYLINNEQTTYNQLINLIKQFNNI